jgi:hypothetical protein
MYPATRAFGLKHLAAGSPQSMCRCGLCPVPGGLATASSPDDVPTVFTALREQMGLKLDAETGRADVWVIDAVSQPTLD